MHLTRFAQIAAASLAALVVLVVVVPYLLDWPPYAMARQGNEMVFPEGARGSENLLWPSEDFANARWQEFQIAKVETGVAASPNGEKTASKLIEAAADGRHFIFMMLGGITPGTVLTFSIYVKPAERSRVRLEIRDNPQKRYGTAVFALPRDALDVFNVPTRATLTSAGDLLESHVDPVKDGWYRCWAAMPFDLENVALGIELLAGVDDQGYMGDGRSGILLWGAQFEEGRVPTAYVPSSTGPVLGLKTDKGYPALSSR